MKLRRLKQIDHFLGSPLIFVLRIPSLLLGLFLKRDHQLSVEKHLVVLKLLGGGSLLIALPALQALRRRFPHQRFTLICTPQVVPFAELTGVFDDYAVIRTGGIRALLTTAWTALRTAFCADCLLNYEIHSKLAAVFSLLTCARNRLGFYMSWNRWQFGLTTHWFFYNEAGPIYLAYNQMAAALGAEVSDMLTVSDGFISSNRLQPVALQEKKDRFTFALAPFCSELCKEREFKPSEWAQVFSRLVHEPNAAFYILGVESEREKAEEIGRCLQAALPDCIVRNRCGELSLLQSTVVLMSVDHVVTIDSGLNHIARLLRSRITSFWGPSDPKRRLAPFPEKSLNETVRYQQVFCSPCVHVIDEPPCKGRNICMQRHLSDVAAPEMRRGWCIGRES